MAGAEIPTGREAHETTDFELDVLQANARLTAALRTALDYIDQIAPEAKPASIGNLRRHLESPQALAGLAFDDAADFAALVASMGRFMTQCAAMNVFESEGLELAEWVVMSALDLEPGLTNRQLCRQIGVTGKRGNRIIASLKEAGLLEVTASEDDPRTVALTMTRAGQAQLQAVKDQLVARIRVALGNDRLKLRGAAKTLRDLSRVHD